MTLSTIRRISTLLAGLPGAHTLTDDVINRLPHFIQDQKRWEDEQREMARQRQLMQLQQDERSAILEVSCLKQSLYRSHIYEMLARGA